MIYRMLLVIFSAVILTGCAAPTHSRSGQSQNLQFKIAQMERKLNEREQEVQELRYEIDRLSQDLEDAQIYEEEVIIEEPVVVDYNYNAKSSGKDERIIRVSASPQSVQRALKNAGYYTGPIDGKIGRGSKKAIREFQTDHGLKTDGIIGKQTWSKLQEYLSK